jgi:hypothetical protein
MKSFAYGRALWNLVGVPKSIETIRVLFWTTSWGLSLWCPRIQKRGGGGTGPALRAGVDEIRSAVAEYESAFAAFL